MREEIPLDQAFVSHWREALAADPEAGVRGHHCSLELCLYLDDQPLLLTVRQGALIDGEFGPWHMRAADLTIKASGQTWQRFWQRLPPPGFHDLMAMSSYGHCHIEGNIHTLRTHLGFIKSLMAAPRQFLATSLLPGVG
ncbi:MAG: hypothetical protein ACRBC3_08900 [Burkholderiaceae bacterium]